MARVALYARAWVEIPKWCPLKNFKVGRPLREGVGRNLTRAVEKTTALVALYARAWVEIKLIRIWNEHNQGRPLREGVGRNNRDLPRPRDFGVALYARAWVEISSLLSLSILLLSPSTRGRG